MRGWYYFWVANFALAGSAFLGIALVVMVGGIGDLRHMFRSLRQSREEKNPPGPGSSIPR
jgi:hypothetical protein